eukprot:TRINITY_DN1103_c0_g1_i1.p1 TRINITY_DN1103_c0_g1~~TRINITY_DN1103_c0_g1_i1.p1  ORF type:complete len:413 (+),score=115.11 TRINITY_DN1103_c0_g1_i1:87-1325(+)
MKAQIYNLVLVCGMLITGAVNTLSKKAQNDSTVKGWNGDEHQFTHPWFQTLVMFSGEFLCLAGYFIQMLMARRNAIKKDEPVEKLNLKNIFHPIFLLPTMLDLLGTTFGGIGLVYCSASVWQMLRGSIIIFTGILSRVFLKRKMLPYRWISMGITLVGLILVGVSGILTDMTASTSGSSSGDSGFDYSMIFGMLMIIAGQFVGAIQMVLEETFLKGRKFEPMHVVGMEGLLGAIIMATVVLPALYIVPGTQPCSLPYDDYENSVDALMQIFHSWQLVCFVFLYLGSIAFYNFFGLSVTKSLTCVHRTLIDACRTIIVWTSELFIGVFDPTFGETWTNWSYIQVAGFLILIAGTILYNGIVKIPGLQYEQPSKPAAPTPAESAPLLAQQDQTPTLTSINTTPVCTPDRPANST